MQDSNTSSKDHTPNTTPSKLKFDDKYATPESPDTFPFVHGSMNLNAPGTGTKVIQRCMTDLDDLISRRKKELSDIQHSGLKSSHKKKSAIEVCHCFLFSLSLMHYIFSYAMILNPFQWVAIPQHLVARSRSQMQTSNETCTLWKRRRVPSLRL